jgi:hypothetical protein
MLICRGIQTLANTPARDLGPPSDVFKALEKKNKEKKGGAEVPYLELVARLEWWRVVEKQEEGAREST